ncbi:unnamed protein product, partial [Chrysoparadoxa australica]
TIILPIARVKKAIKLDPEVKSVSKEGLALIAKATELMIASLAKGTWRSMAGKKGMKSKDLANFAFPKPSLYWLKDELRRERRCSKWD